MQEIVNAVVIDDNQDDLMGISTALAKQGISTIPIHYRGSANAQEAYDACKGAASARPRIIITDIQMNHGGQEPTKTDLGNVTRCLEEIVSRISGPYIILAWTSIPNHFSSLKEYVEKYLTKKKLHQPLYFESICKNQCKPRGQDFCAQTIFSKFSEHFTKQKEFRALLHWENGVYKAGIDAVNEIIDSQDQGSLKSTLKMLAEQVAGNNLLGNESIAVNEALIYILKDRLSYISLEKKSIQFWGEALKGGSAGTLTAEIKAKLNTILHFDKNVDSSIICPGDIWKIKSENHFLSNMCSDKKIPDFISEFKQEFYKNTPVTGEEVICMEISPACDFAQDSKSLKSFVLGLLIPTDQTQNPNVSKKLKEKRETILCIPIKIEEQIYALCVSKKYILSFSKDKINGYERIQGTRPAVLDKFLRMRETMLLSWIHSLSAHNSRIGTVSFQ